MIHNRKVAAVVMTAVAITGSATALANASGAKVRTATKTTKITTVSRSFNVNGMADMQRKHGFGGPLTSVLADLVTKGTITAAESKAVSDAYAALEAAEHSATTTPTTPKMPPAAGEISPELTAALADLVKKGTLTQAKSDAITAAVKADMANRPAKGPMGMDGKGGPMGDAQKSNMESVVTTTLGIDANTLRTRIAAGESLATIAGDKKDALIAALVAEMTKQIDAAVTAGKLTAAQATSMKTNLTAHVTEEVNETGHMGGFGPGRGHGGKGGHGGHGDMDGHGQMGMPNGTKNGIPQTSTSGTNN